MMHRFPPSSSVSSATLLVAINSAVVAIGETDAAEDDPVKRIDDSERSSNSVKQDRLFTKYSATLMKPDIGILSKDFMKNKGREQTTTIANSAPSIVQTQSTAVMKPDVGILSKDFLKNKGRGQSIDKKFAIHRKKRAAAADVDVGILDNGRRQQASRANLHDKNKVTGRSLQSEEELPWMCPGKYGLVASWYYFDNLFNETDSYFPKCSCPSPTTCGPNLCECLELDADDDIFQCMDPFNQLCEGTKYIEGIPGPWSMEKCLGDMWYALHYCSMLPCYVNGGSYWKCKCQLEDSLCTEYRYGRLCAMSKCCQAQIDDEGREACFNGGYENYYDQVISFSISGEEMISRFNECAFNSGDDKSIVQCYCESFSYGLCVNWGVEYPDLCEANICCDGQTEDDARLGCFSRFRGGWTGYDFYYYRDAVQEGCVASGRSSDQCMCDIQGLSNCVGVETFSTVTSREPRCDLLQCCQSQTDDNDDDGRKDCLVQDEVQLMYDTCVNDGNTTQSCFCEKSNMLCSSGHSNDLHCELSSCCQEQADDTGLKECIGNFTTSQPSSAPSGTTPAENSIDEAEASPTAASALPGTSSASISTPFGAKSPSKTTSKMLAVTAAAIGWVLLT